MMLHGIHNAVIHVVFQNHFAGVVDGVSNGSQLDQNFGAVPSVLHHFFHTFQMTDGAGKAVGNPLDVLGTVGVAVGAMNVGVIMFVGMLVEVDMGNAVFVQIVMLLGMGMLMCMNVLVFAAHGHTS